MDNLPVGSADDDVERSALFCMYWLSCVLLSRSVSASTHSTLALGLRQGQSVGDESLGVQIEFPQRYRVAAASPKGTTITREFPGSGCVQLSSQSLSSSAARRSMSSSVSQAGSALRKSSSVVRRQQAARIFGILPEIVDQPAAAV